MFNSRIALTAHLKRHESVEKVQCPHCNDRMKSESLRRHIRVRHEGYKPFGW